MKINDDFWDSLTSAFELLVDVLNEIDWIFLYGN